MQFCSVGTLKLNNARRSGAGERAYMFDSTIAKPKTKEEYLKIIPSARTIGLGTVDGKIKCAPVAGVLSGKRFLLALGVPAFNMTSGNFATGTRDFDSMLNMYGIYSPDNLTSPGTPNVTQSPRIAANSDKATCDKNNALTFSGAMMVIAPPVMENQNLRYDVYAGSAHSYFVDKSRWNGGGSVYTTETYTQYMRALAMLFSNYTQNNQKSGAINSVPAGASAVSLGAVVANAANFYQPVYDYYLFVNNSGGGSPSTTNYAGTYQLAGSNNFTQTSAPYISVSTADEEITLSFSAMIHKEMNEWRMTVSDFGTDLILDGAVTPNTSPTITLIDGVIQSYPLIYIV